MRWLILCAALTMFAVPDRPPPPDTGKNDLANLDGTWAVVAYEFDGGKLPDAQIATYPRLIIKAGTFRWTNVESVGTLKLDPTKTPRQVEYTLNEDPTQPMTFLGIYELRGDTFRDCIAPPGKERPRDFTVPAGSGRMMFLYQRVKN